MSLHLSEFLCQCTGAFKSSLSFKDQVPNHGDTSMCLVRIGVFNTSEHWEQSWQAAKAADACIKRNAFRGVQHGCMCEMHACGEACTCAFMPFSSSTSPSNPSPSPPPSASLSSSLPLPPSSFLLLPLSLPCTSHSSITVINPSLL